jgi:hypothetical protein
MPNQPSEAYHVRQYLVNCFVPRAIANLFSNWNQANRYLYKDYTLYEALHLVSGETKKGITTIHYPDFYDNIFFWYEAEYGP